MANRKKTILVGEVGSASAADKIERWAHMVGIKPSIVWMEEMGLYRVTYKHETDFFQTPNLVIIHLIEVAHVWAKSKE